MRTTRDITRKTIKHISAKETILIVLDGLRGKESVSELCHIGGIAQGLYYKGPKDFLEAGRKRLAGDTVRQAKTIEVRGL